MPIIKLSGSLFFIFDLRKIEKSIQIIISKIIFSTFKENRKVSRLLSKLSFYQNYIFHFIDIFTGKNSKVDQSAHNKNIQIAISKITFLIFKEN